MDRLGRFNREEFRRFVAQVRPEFMTEESYFIIVEVSGEKATVKVVDRLVTTTLADGDSAEDRAEEAKEGGDDAALSDAPAAEVAKPKRATRAKKGA